MTDNWALAFAALSLLISVIGFGWQIVSWRLGRPVVKVHLAMRMIITSAPGMFMSLRVANVGGMPVTIKGVGVQQHRWRWSPRRHRTALFIIPLQYGDLLPHRLEPGAEAIFIANQPTLVQQMDEIGASHMHPWAGLATGKVKVGRRFARSDADKLLTPANQGS